MRLRNAALFILVDKKGHILLQLKSEGHPIAGMWAFFGGAIEEGETPEEAVAREAKEELEYELKRPRKVMEQVFQDPEHEVHGVKHIYVEEVGARPELVLHEGQDMGWFSIPEALTLEMPEHDYDVLRRLEQIL